MTQHSLIDHYTERKANVTVGGAGFSPVYYFDRLTFWLTEPISPQHVRRLRRQCHWQKTDRKPMRFDKDFKHRLQVVRPTLAYLLLMQEIEQTQRISINYGEFARDECFPTQQQLFNTQRMRRMCEVRLWHHKNQDLVTTAEGQDFDGGRKRRRMMTRYAEPHSRITGELYCLHTEFRLRGAQAVKRAGITCVQDLIEFDHVAWWQAKTRMLDLEKLGRLFRNKRHGTRDRSPRFESDWRGVLVNVDAMAGQRLWYAHGRNQHQCIRRCREHVRVEHAMKRINRVGEVNRVGNVCT